MAALNNSANMAAPRAVHDFVIVVFPPENHLALI
jgi:hypothetical protein